VRAIESSETQGRRNKARAQAVAGIVAVHSRATARSGFTTLRGPGVDRSLHLRALQAEGPEEQACCTPRSVGLRVDAAVSARAEWCRELYSGTGLFQLPARDLGAPRLLCTRSRCVSGYLEFRLHKMPGVGISYL
jgi:hypothetical protein